MRIYVALLVCMTALTNASAADKMIRLSKSINFDPVPKEVIKEAPAKPATPEAASASASSGVLASASSSASSSASISASSSASSSASASASSSASASASASAKESANPKTAAAREAALKEQDEQSRMELSAKVAERLAALRKLKEAPKVKSRYVYGHKGAKKTAAKEHASKESASHEHAVHWSYGGQEGPESWGKLSSLWSKCGTGTRQSPIDINDGIRVDLDPVRFDYKPTSFNVINNGHTVQVNMGTGNFITIMGSSYELLQFHFHRPSEERVNGKTFQMVIHLVHKNDEGKLAVVAKAPLDIGQLLPVRREYFTYMGSLTTPPCSEEVMWIVVKEPLRLSAQQIEIFARLYPMNARPIQPKYDRLIKESN